MNVAEVTIDDTTTQYSDLSTAWAACDGEAATLKLLANVEITSELNKSWAEQDLLLDLNGHTLKQTGSARIIRVLGKLTVSNGVLTRSGAAYSGDGAGILVCHNDDDEYILTRLVMRDVTMTNCVATSNGGAIYAERDTQVLLENCTLRQNEAGGSGGAVYTYGGATESFDPGAGESAKVPWDKLVLISTVITDNKAGTSGSSEDPNGAGVFYKHTVEGSSCFAAGTLVRMADGSDRKVEEVAEGDIVRTFDHEGGTNSTAHVFLTVKEKITTRVFVLTFADGYSVRCVLTHDFLMKDDDRCKYVCLSRRNAADYIGKSFYAVDGQWHELLSVMDGETVDEVYEIYTSRHLNSYADGLLTVPADVAHVLGIYKLGADLKADAEQLAADVAQYGLVDFAAVSSKYGMSRAWYDDANAQYAYVIIGKGLSTRAQLEALYRSTQEVGASVQPKKTTALPKLMAAPKLMSTSSASDPLADYPASRLTLGAGTIVTNNLVGITPNNIYLANIDNNFIALADARADICAGVTLGGESGKGQFTAFYYANPGDIGLFRSDNANYAVWYDIGDDGSFLKLAEGSQIAPPSVANTSYVIWKGDEVIAWNEATTVDRDAEVTVVYTADDGYLFPDYSTQKAASADTSKSMATMTPPAAPFYVIARSEKADGGSSVTKYHPSLAAAVDAIGAGGTGTVTMCADATMAQSGAAWVPDEADITLDLAGKKIDWTTTRGDSLFYFAADTHGKLTIEDSGVGGTIAVYCDSSEVTNSALVAYCDGNGDLTVNGGTFVASNKVGAATLFFKSGSGDWTFNGGSYKALGEGAGGAHFLYCGAATGTTRITGGTYDICATAGAAAGVGSNAECFDKITLMGGDFDVVTKGAWSGAFSCGNGSMVVNGGDFGVTSSAPGVYCILAERNGTTILSNGTFRAETTSGYAYAAGATQTASLTIAGGTYFAKAFNETAATVVGKEGSQVTLVGNPVINNGATGGTAWNLAVQLFGSHLDFAGYTGTKLPALAVFADGTYGVSYVTGDMTNFDAAWIWAGYFSTRPEDSTVQDGKSPIVNLEASTKANYPWTIGLAAAEAGASRGYYYTSIVDAWRAAADEEWKNKTNVFVRLLADVTIDAPLAHEKGAVLTLDLNDKVLAYAGPSNACAVLQRGGRALCIVDTAATRTPRYFTREASGLWTRADHETDLVVRGGLITGGRESAVIVSYGGAAISNVNFVGNSSVASGGAVYVTMGSLTVAGSTFFGNVSAQNGGAISAVNTCEMSDCRVEANVAANQGGGVYMKFSGTLVRTSVVGNKAEKGGGVYLTYVPGCFPAGVKIRMADGTEKSVEKIVKGDVVATFDHIGGTNSSAVVFYVYRGMGAQNVFTLSFASGATLDIADRHDLLAEATHKYVTVSFENARQFIGKRFYNYVTGNWDELTGVTDATATDGHYSIYTRGHANCVANGLLTVPDDKDCFINVYELDEGLKADAAQLAADIATYGLATPADYPNVPLDDFEDGNMRYARIAIGKGLTTQEAILYWNEYDYGPIVAKKSARTPKRAMSAAPPLLTSGSGGTIPAPAIPYLQVGKGAVVTGNVTSVGETSNVHLDRSIKKSVIDVQSGATDVDVGVTLSTGTGIFGHTNTVNNAAFFFADNPAYSVSYTADGELALRAGIQVGGDAWATVADGVCTIIGTGAMWNHNEWTAGNPLAAERMAVNSVVIADGVTSVGSQAFHKFYALTNVTCAASVTTVGDHAFYRCASLEAMSFAGADAPTFGTNAYTLHAGISIKDGMPDVYAVPTITISGYTQNLYGRVNLTEGDWEKITTDAQKRACRFFKIVMEK